MTNSKEISSSKDKTNRINQWAYGAFVLLGVYFLLVRKDIASAMSNLGIALVFDPFNQKITWNNRPLYQRVWLFVHVSFVLLLLVYWLGRSFDII